MSEQSLFKVDSITINGAAYAFQEGTAIINGVGGYVATAVPSGSGPDYESHAREPRTIELNLQFGRAVNPAELRAIQNARVVLKDSRGPRRCLAPNCSFASMGPVGQGAVRLVLNALEDYQWL